LTVPSKTRYAALLEKKSPAPVPHQSEDQEDEEEEDDEVLSEISEEFDDGGSDDDNNASENSDDESKSSEVEDEDEDEDEAGEDEDEDETMNEVEEAAVPEPEAPIRERKRKRKDDNDDLEDKYMTKLAQEDEPEGKRLRGSDSGAKDGEAVEDDDDAIPVHESLAKDDQTSELDKASRTVFLANVASSAITSKSAKKALLAHLTSIFPDEPSSPKVESLRFRSVAFSEMSMPKRAAYITGALLNATTQSTNAYAVYSTSAAARKAAAELNGTTVLERHIRVDSVAHPTPTDHRRCVFVGNLGFVDDETVVRKDENGETIEKKRNKVPADVEEGLWRTFGAHGKVENVRVVRDPKTRVGKGFAYVQFYVSGSLKSLCLLQLAHTQVGCQCGRVCSSLRRKEVPAYASASSPRDPRQRPSQDRPRPGTITRQNSCTSHQEHQIQVQAYARGAINGWPYRKASRSLCRISAEKGWQEGWTEGSPCGRCRSADQDAGADRF
jgi:nucleolar protein 12